MEESKSMYKLKFKNTEKMGTSPRFNSADVELWGDFVPELEGRVFQDKGAITKEGDICFLVEWVNPSSQVPGFRVWRVSAADRTVTQSEVIEGCCESIASL